MLPIVSLPDPGDFDRPQRYDLPADLLGDDLLAYQVATAPEQLAIDYLATDRPVEWSGLLDEDIEAFFAEEASLRIEKAVRPELESFAEAGSPEPEHAVRRSDL